MNIEINRMLAPITVLGAGRRFGLWVQGCRLRCPGCASADTWIPGEGRRHDVVDLAGRIAAEVAGRHLEGLTVTGGEPLDQAEAIAALVEQLRTVNLAHWSGAADFDVVVFTGYSAAAAPVRAGRLWPMIDVAVCGPYRQDMPGDAPMVASANQELLILTDLGRAKYPLDVAAPRMQVVSDGADLMMVGLPRPGDLDAISWRLAERGVALGGASWRS